jgi:hypothetical protein
MAIHIRRREFIFTLGGGFGVAACGEGAAAELSQSDGAAW